MKVAWTFRAARDLGNLHAHIAKDDLRAANNVVLSIRAVTEKLAKHPGMGRVGRKKDTRELVFSALAHIVVYAVSADTVSVLRVIHTSRLHPS